MAPNYMYKTGSLFPTRSIISELSYHEGVCRLIIQSFSLGKLVLN
jgi:hypothetical protein